MPVQNVTQAHSDTGTQPIIREYMNHESRPVGLFHIYMLTMDISQRYIFTDRHTLYKRRR
jgi:hypothetical protein